MYMWGLVESRHSKYMEGVPFHVCGAGIQLGPLAVSTDICSIHACMCDVCVYISLVAMEL